MHCRIMFLAVFLDKIYHGQYINAMSEYDSMIVARDLFLAKENRASLNGLLKLSKGERLTKQQFAGWYDDHMQKYRIETSKIDNVIVWQDYMNQNYIREYRGHHCITESEIPYLAFDTPSGEKEVNHRLIEQTQPDGKFPKFKLESAIEDRRDPETGEIIIRNAHKVIRMFQPARPWRHPGAKGPVSSLLKGQSQNGSRLIDRDYRGSLYDFELLSRKHTPRPMDMFLINEDRRTKIAARSKSSPEYLW